MTLESSEQSIILDGGISLPVRVYRGSEWSRAAPLVFHLHGGAFIGGSLDAGRTVATLLAEAGAIVVSVAYPLAPGCQFPKPLQISFCALKSLYNDRAKWASRKSGVYVAGEEAGGNLAAGLALMARDQAGPPLAGQILLSPMLDPCLATKSARDAEAGPVGCKWADGWNQYLGSADRACHPYATPLNSSRLAHLAPALILTAQDDLLRDECLNYAKRLRDAGSAVQCHVLDAPTGWPCSFGPTGKAKPPWMAELHDHFVGFFAGATSSLHSATVERSGLA